jgi:Uma2 family endonuclease
MAMMIPAITRDLTFEAFIDVEDGNELNEFELVDGRLVLMPEPDDWHEEILEFLSFMFELQYRRWALRYSVRKRNALMIDNTRGRRPDVAVIDRPTTRGRIGNRGFARASNDCGDCFWELEYGPGGEAGGV